MQVSKGKQSQVGQKQSFDDDFQFGKFTRASVYSMKRLTLALVLILPSFANAGNAENWLQPVPPAAGNVLSWVDISKETYFEIPASKLLAAEYWLRDSAFLPQEQNEIKYFGRPDFNCPASTKPYLVRAAYINGGTGSFGLHWAGSALIVSHASLGPSGSPSKSALIACLAKEPTAVFSSLSGAL